MSEIKVGGFVVSAAGHDSGQYYVIFQMDDEYVYLVDGRIRTRKHLKKKKIKHVTMLEQSDPLLAERVNSRNVKDEEIKRAIKILKQRDLNRRNVDVKD